MRWRRRDVLSSLGATSVLGALGLPDRARAVHGDPPNLLYIIVDQCRAAALSCYGETNITTPHLDALAADGVRFTKLYNSKASCTESRATLMSGQFPNSLGVFSNMDLLPPVPCLAEPFRDAGYACGHVGKWHLDGVDVDHDSTCYVEPGWRRRGFDHFWASHRANHIYNEAHTFRDSPVIEYPNPPDLYGPYYRAALASEFLEARLLEPDTPWFLMVSFGPPHPAIPDADWASMIPAPWRSLVNPSGLSFRPNVPVGRLLPDLTLDRQDRLGVHGYLHLYYASLLSLDTMVGHLVSWLKDKGLYENTIIVFTSDHGELGGSQGFFEKQLPFDEANRVPMIAVWKDHIPEGSEITAPAAAADIYASVLGLAGLAPGGPHHGRDLSSLMTGAGGSPPVSAYVEGRVDPQMTQYLSGTTLGDAPFHIVRTEPWYYVESMDGSALYLYNMVTDPYQLDNLVGQAGFGGIAGDLSDLLATWASAVGASPDTGP